MDEAGRRCEEVAVWELRRFDTSLELAVKQALRRMKETAERDVAALLPRQCSKFIASSEEFSALKQRTLASVEEKMIQRCTDTLHRLSTDVVLRESLASAAEVCCQLGVR